MENVNAKFPKLRELWSGAIEIYQSDFKRFVMFSFLMFGAAFLNDIFKYVNFTTLNQTHNSLSIAKTVLEFFCAFLSYLIGVMITQSVANRFNGLANPAFKASLQYAGNKVFRVFFVRAGRILVLILPGLLAVFAAQSSLEALHLHHQGNGLLFLGLSILALIPTFYLYVIFFFSEISAVLEKDSLNSFVNSFSLIHHCFWRVLPIIIPMLFLFYGAPIAFEIVGSIYKQDILPTIKLGLDLTASLLSALLLPLATAYFTPLYFQLKELRGDSPWEKENEGFNRYFAEPVQCLQCGMRIEKEENSCPQCGWSWQNFSDENTQNGEG